MKCAWILCGAVLVASVSITAASADDRALSEARMRATVRTLAGNDFEGRAPGSRGEALTLEYLQNSFRELGYSPGNPDGTFLQKVPLVSTTVTNSPALAIRSSDGRFHRQLAYGPQYMGGTLQRSSRVEIESAEMVFVGYGTVAPEYGWDDYKDIDVRGKVIVMLVNDPPLEDKSMFGGDAMTYYGRWTYKFEIAAEKGALGAVLIHNADAAGYPWEVVENSWSGEQFDVVRDDSGMSRCALESWIAEDVAETLFSAAGRSYEASCREAVSAQFRPYSLGLQASVALENRMRTIDSYNVVARIAGNSPSNRDETIIYTAHWDHLGVGNPVAGDSIYNGALDNASGVAGVLEIAAAFARTRAQLSRSVLFIITTAEESGLLGARYYAEHPLYPLAKTVASINVDGVNIWGRTRDMVVVGFGQSDLDSTLAAVLTEMDRFIVPDSEPEKGYYYRSDHFPFAKRGVPALYADSGIAFRNRPEGWGMQMRSEYTRERYHKPQDEYEESWNLSGALEDMTALFEVGRRLATTDRFPQWRTTSEFRRVRDAMLGGSR